MHFLQFIQGLQCDMQFKHVGPMYNSYIAMPMDDSDMSCLYRIRGTGQAHVEFIHVMLMYNSFMGLTA